jgi:hypothetical protein
MIRNSLSLATGGLALFFAVPAEATDLGGEIYFGGGSTNYFNPANGFVPAGYGNTGGATGVTIGAGIEFGFQDGVNLDTANFTSTGFTISDISSSGEGASTFTMRFTANDSYFSTLSLVSDTFGGSFSVVGNQFTYIAPEVTGVVTRTAVFSTVAQGGGVPEPATWALLLLGFGFACAGMRKARLRQTVRYSLA